MGALSLFKLNINPIPKFINALIFLTARYFAFTRKKIGKTKEVKFLTRRIFAAN